MGGLALARTMADAAAALGLPVPGPDLERDVDELAGPVLRTYTEHPNWPTRFTAARAPFEFSIAMGAGGHSFRYAADVTDYRRDLARNWPDYLQAASRAVGVDGGAARTLQRLVGTHLDGCPGDRRLRMAHGIGHGDDGRRRSTLYFSVNWLSMAGFRSRFPAPAAALEAATASRGRSLPDEVGAIGRDFDRGSAAVTATKMYVWHSVADGAQTLVDVVGRHEDLALAEAVFTEFLPGSDATSMHRSLAWVVSTGRSTDRPREKVHFLCPAWGWDVRDGLARLAARLSELVGHDLWQLASVLEVFAARSIRISPTVVAIGPGTDLAFYFVPALEGSPIPADAFHEALRRGERYLQQAGRALVDSSVDGNETVLRRLLSRQRADGGWEAPEWTDDLLATGMALHDLSQLEGRRDELGRAAKRACGEARGFLADRPVGREPLLLGAWLGAWLTAGGSTAHPSVRRIVAAIVESQQSDGSWLPAPARLSSGRYLDADPDGVLTSATVVEALRKHREAGPAAPLHGDVEGADPRHPDHVQLG